MPSAASIADRRDVVDVDAEAQCRQCHHTSRGCGENRFICLTLVSRNFPAQAIARR
jgi:hypothetical protein